MLILPISAYWLNRIARGDKEDEYREIKPYWTTRFKKVFKFNGDIPVIDDVHKVAFRAGYNKNSKTLICDVTLSIGAGRADWGAVEGKEYYKLHILTKQLSV